MKEVELGQAAPTGKQMRWPLSLQQYTVWTQDLGDVLAVHTCVLGQSPRTHGGYFVCLLKARYMHVPVLPASIWGGESRRNPEITGQQV